MGVQVREKPKGSGTWWVFINHHGRRKSKKVGSEESACDLAEKARARLTFGILDVEKINRKCPIFKEYAAMWLALPSDRKRSTMANYARSLKRHVYPAIGNLRVDEIRRKDIKLLFDKLLTQGIQPGSFSNVRAPIRVILDHAVESELIETNPVNGIKSKKRSKHQVDPLTELEAFSLIEEVKKYKDGISYPPILCSLRTGMRIGELQALTWADVDFENRLISVSKSFDGKQITSPKNRKPRKVDMSPHLTDTLKVLKKSQWRKYVKLNKPVPQWVFAGIKGAVLNRDKLRESLNECLEKAGLKKIRVHDLRHSYATIRLLKGHNPGDVSYQLGHSSISITYDVYSHWIPGSFKSQVDELDMHPSAPQPHPETKEVENI